MSSLAKVFVALGLLCIAAQAANVQNFSVKFDEPLLPRFYTVSENIDQSLVYMICNENKEQREINCWLRLKMVNGDNKNCNVTLALPRDKNLDLYFFSTMYLKSMLAGNKIVFEWALWASSGSKPHRWVSLVDMNTCNAVHLDFELDKGIRQRHRSIEPNYHLLVYHDSFHVCVNSEVICGREHNPCILRYNPDGQQVSKPVAFPSKNFRNWHSMVVDQFNSSSGGFFTTFENGIHHSLLMNVSLVSNDGSETLVFKNHFIKDDFTYDFVVRSNEHGYFSLCHPEELESAYFQCIQYDANGRKMINTTITLEGSDKVLKIFSQRQGGIVIVYLDYNSQVKVTEVNIHGNVTRNTKLTGVELDGSLRMCKELRINYLESDTEQCFYFAYGRQRRLTTEFKYFSKCMNNTNSSSKF